MKKLLIATLACLMLLCSCTQTQPETPAQPEWYEAFRDECAVIYALPVTSSDAECTLELTVENVGQEDIVLSSVLCLSAVDEFSASVPIASAQGLDCIIPPGQSVSGSIVFGRGNLDGCVVSVAIDFAAGRWIALNLT